MKLLRTAGSRIPGFVIAGLGCATRVPAAFTAAGRVPKLPERTGIAIIRWLMRIGLLVTSPVIGILFDAWSLRVAMAMAVPVAAGFVAALFADRSASSPRVGATAGCGHIA